MKLLTIIKKRFAYYSVLILSLGLILTYLFTKSFIITETDELLKGTKLRVIKSIIQNSKVEFAPFIEIHELQSISHSNITEAVSDTLIYNNIENEEISYRQLKSIFSYEGKYYLIVVRTDSVEQTELFFSIGLPIFIVLLLFVILFNLAVRKISHSVWQPFYNNIEILKKFSTNDMEKLHLTKSNIQEFNDLDKSLLELTERIRSDYQKQKEFSENASHELQTPIAIIKSKIESLLQNDTFNHDAIIHLQTIDKTVNRLSRLNKSLTLLAKIDSIEYEEKKEINLREFIQQRIEDFDEIAAEKGVKIKKEFTSEVRLKINDDLFTILFSNLLSNAIRYNVDNGEITIELKDKTLTIINTGKPLEKESSKMFERFEKGDQSSESSGLGLTIVKQICDLYKFNIEYSYQNFMHTIRINFS